MNERGSISKHAWVGSDQQESKFSDPITAASGPYSEYFYTDRYTNLVVDIKIDKGATVVITPILSNTNRARTGEPSTTGVIADGGGTCRFKYSCFSAPQALIEVTKTEAGDSTVTEITFSGTSV